MAKKAPVLPLKEVMAALDKKDKGWYNRLTPEKKKAFSTWMMMRYASSVQGRNAANFLFMVNELVNKDFEDIYKYPELQWLLMSACGTGKIEFHPYIKPPNSRKKKDKVSEFILGIYPHLKSDELELMLSINSKEDLKDFARAHGYDDKTIKDTFGK
tara:strand:+ start:1365 stop:1835 length:471 start_codon:yes stop_codon:yes gene_type:complete